MCEFNTLEKIIYKQNALADLSEYVKKYKKIMIFTSKTPKKLYFTSLCGFLNENKINFLCTELNLNTPISSDTILKSTSKALGCDCIIAFGAGSVCDVTKLVANKLHLPYIVVPTTVSHFGYFTNYAFVQSQLCYKKVKCNFPEKIFIDETFIKNSSDYFVLSTCSFVFSFLETYISETIKNKFFNINNSCEINTIKQIILKTEGLLNWLSMHNDAAYLNLMDNVIELFTIINNLNIDLPLVELTFLNAREKCKFNFGKNCLINSSILLMCYKNFWSEKNLDYKNMPNIEKNIKILEKYGKNCNFLFDFINNFKILTSNKFFLKAKSIKNNIYTELSKTTKKTSTLSKKLLNIFNEQEFSTFNETVIFDNIKFIALSTNSFQLNALMRLGYLNF